MSTECISPNKCDTGKFVVINKKNLKFVMNREFMKGVTIAVAST